MKTGAIVTSAIGLLLTIVPAIMVFAGALPWATHAHLMTAGMVLWFVAAPVWFKE